MRPQDPGGTRHYDFARIMAQKGHQVTVLAGTRSYLTGELLDSEQREQKVPGLEIVRCGVIGGANRGFVWRTVGYFSFVFSSFWHGLKTRGVDVIWGTSPPLFQGWTAWLLARLKRIRWALEVRDLWPEFAIQVGALQSRTLISLSRWLERFLYNHADHIVVNSPGFVPYVQGFDINKDRVSCIPNGVDLEWATAGVREQSLLRLPHRLEGKFIALYAGAIGMANDLSQVVEAARIVREDPRIAIVLIGEGPERSKLQVEARRNGLNNLFFMPPLKKSDMPTLLSEVDCGVAVLKPIPIFDTTYPNKVFDYMAAGLPVVLAIDGAIRTVVESANAGLYVDPGDAAGIAAAITRLASEPGLARDLGRNGRAHVEQHFARSEMAEKMEAILASLVE